MTKICVKLLVSDPGSEGEGRRQTVSKSERRPGHQTDGWMGLGKVSRRGVGERGGKNLTDRQTDDRMDGRKPQIFLLRK